MSKSLDLMVVVIGQPGSLRNPQLSREIQKFKHTFVPPVFVTKDLADSRSSQKLNLKLLGRALVAGEVGCALAHVEARREGSSADWVLVLEDDANINSEQIKASWELVRGIELKKPSIVTLVDPNAGKLRKLRLAAIPYAPSTTLAYFASSAVAALDLASQEIVGTADWPLHLQGCKFLELSGLGITPVDSNSLIDEISVRPPQRATRFSLAMNSLLHFSESGVNGVKLAFLTPFLRDAHSMIKTGWLK